MNIHIKTALDSIKRSPFQALSAILVLTLTFFVGTVLAVLVYSSSKVLTYFETRPQVIAFLKEDASKEDISGLQGKLLGDQKIKDVKYVSKEEALSIYKEATSDNPLLSELVNPAIFPASLEFSLRDLNFADSLIEEVKKSPAVSSVCFTASLGCEAGVNDVLGRLKKITFYIRTGGIVLASFLGVTSLFVLLVIISFKMSGRKDEVEILKLIGATGSFIRLPIMLESFIYGVTGAVMGWLLGLILFIYLTPSVVSYFKDIPIFPDSTEGFVQLFGLILLSEIVVGIVLGFLGAKIAISRSKTRG